MQYLKTWVYNFYNIWPRFFWMTTHSNPLSPRQTGVYKTKNPKSIVENTNSLLERALSNFKAHSFLWPRSSNSIHSKYSSTVKSQSNWKYTLTTGSVFEIGTLIYSKSWMITCDENPCLNAFSIAEVILSVEFWLTEKRSLTATLWSDSPNAWAAHPSSGSKFLEMKAKYRSAVGCVPQ